MSKIHREFKLRAGQHQYPHLRHRSLRGAPRRVPGFQPHHAGMPALARASRRVT
jgi:hypothetical protein